MATAPHWIDDKLDKAPDDEVARLYRQWRFDRALARWAEIAATFPALPQTFEEWKAAWPGFDYAPIIKWRQDTIALVAKERLDPAAILHWYAENRVVEFINHWGITYDPRAAKRIGTTHPPFILFPRQHDLIEFLLLCLDGEEHGLIEKCRDMGATWVCCFFSIWLWLTTSAAVGWGSRKEELVDRIGDPDAIFEKIRMGIRHLPRFLVPNSLSDADNLVFMKCINPATGATITGEIGDNIGRGGRSLIYFKDEAQPLGAFILTPGGWQTMADMKVGSIVSGPDGLPRRVTQVRDCGLHPIYRLTFSDGTVAECSPNHLWTVEKATGKRERLTLRAHEIAESFRYASPGGQVQYRYRVPVTAAIEFEERGDLPLDPYIVGALIGDGSIATVPKYRPSFTSADPEIVAEIARLLPETCRITAAKERYTYRLGDVDGRRGRGKISRMSLAIMAAGIAGYRAEDKHIPDDRYLFGSPATRLALLQGLMDTDGSASGGVTSFHSCSARLASDVRFLVQSLGGTATHNVKPDHRGHRDMHVLHLAMPDGVVPFRLPRKIAAMKPRKHPTGRTIIGVEQVGEQPVRCISVDADDGLYLTDSLIVTHNSAHYPRPDLIEASLGDNTNVQIDISSVNGNGNVFERRRHAGVDWAPGMALTPDFANVLVMDWREHPGKNEEWYQARRAKAEREGLLHKFKQEVDRDYAASVEGIIIQPEWVRAAIDAHIKLGLDDSGGWSGGLDVADGEGGDTNAAAAFKGIVLRRAKGWGDRDIGVTTRTAIGLFEDIEIALQYDCVGVGAAVKAEANRLAETLGEDGLPLLPDNIALIPWNAGSAVLNPDEPVVPDDRDSATNRDMFANLKAQAWWMVARRFEKTFRAVTEGITYDSSELISIDGTIPLLNQIVTELSQPTIKKRPSDLKLLVNKTPEGTKSPNLGDAIIMAAFPVIGLRPVFATAAPEFRVPPMEMPLSWPRAFAMKVEPERTCVLWSAYDRLSDVLYVTTEHVRSRCDPAVNVAAIVARGKWIPGIVASDETNLDARRELAAFYAGQGLDVILADRSFDAGVQDANQRISTARLKAFATCQSFFTAYRAYRRNEDGEVVGGGLMDCLRLLCRPATISLMKPKPKFDAWGRVVVPGMPREGHTGDAKVGY